MEVTIEWIDVDKAMPPRYQFVIVETLHCRYPHCTAFYDGVNWKCADDDTVMNVKFWAYVQTPAKAHGDGR